MKKTYSLVAILAVAFPIVCHAQTSATKPPSVVELLGKLRQHELTLRSASFEIDQSKQFASNRPEVTKITFAFSGAKAFRREVANGIYITAVSDGHNETVSYAHNLSTPIGDTQIEVRTPQIRSGYNTPLYGPFEWQGTPWSKLLKAETTTIVRQRVDKDWGRVLQVEGTDSKHRSIAIEVAPDLQWMIVSAKVSTQVRSKYTDTQVDTYKLMEIESVSGFILPKQAEWTITEYQADGSVVPFGSCQSSFVTSMVNSVPDDLFKLPVLPVGHLVTNSDEQRTYRVGPTGTFEPITGEEYRRVGGVWLFVLPASLIIAASSLWLARRIS